MKRTFLALAAIAALFVTSCNKNESVETPVPDNGKNFVAYIDNGGAQQAPGKGTVTPKTTINGLNIIWENGDEITVNGQTFTTATGGTNGVTFSGSTAVSAPYHAYYGANKTILLNQNGELYYFKHEIPYEAGKINVPMYAESQSNILTFHNLTAVFKITIPDSYTDGVSRIEVWADQNMYGDAEILKAGDKPYLHITQSSGIGYNQLRFETLGQTIPAGTTVYIPVPQNNYTNLKIKFDGVKVRDLGTRSVEANKVYNITIPTEDPNLLSGEFTVSEGGKKVRFTKGDLMGTAGNYSFAYLQTDAGDNYNWLQWSSSTVVSGESGYEMLSKQEFEYLLGSRTMDNNDVPRYKAVTVPGATCVVIYPNNCTMQHVKNSYTAQEFTDAENAGCVFIATIGWGSSFSLCLWTSTPDGDDPNKAFSLEINGTVSSYYYYVGSAPISTDSKIRLVKTVSSGN